MPTTESRTVTRLLRDWQGGNREIEDILLPLIYGELRKIAAGYLSVERIDHTLEPTALVHEAYLRLIDQRRAGWQDRSHFYAIAARMIRRILVDYARRRCTEKRGYGCTRVSFEASGQLMIERPRHLIALDGALEALRMEDPRKARLVDYRFFGGLSHRECADLLGCSEITIKRHWRLAKAWLLRSMTDA